MSLREKNVQTNHSADPRLIMMILILAASVLLHLSAVFKQSATESNLFQPTNESNCRHNNPVFQANLPSAPPGFKEEIITVDLL